MREELQHMTSTEHSRMLYLLDGLDTASMSVCRRLLVMADKPGASQDYQKNLNGLRVALADGEKAIRTAAKQLREDML